MQPSQPSANNEILKWAQKWRNIMTRPGVKHYVLEGAYYYDEARECGLRFDNGASFIERYPVQSYEEALSVLSQVTDAQLLGTLILSRMVSIYKSEGYAEIDPRWFEIAFDRLIAICK